MRLLICTNFNPRSREGSDPFSITETICISISIHAPARGATEWGAAMQKLTAISIHAPARGATRISRRKVKK